MQSPHGAYHLIARDSAEIVLTIILHGTCRKPEVRVGTLRQLWRSFTLAMLPLAAIDWTGSVASGSQWNITVRH